MRKVTLTKDFSEAVAVTANSAGVYTPIITVTVPRSRNYIFQHGTDLVMKLAVTGGDEIAGGSRLMVSLRRPTERRGRDASGTYTYHAWANVPLSATGGEKTQYDLETTTRRRIAFLQGADISLPQEYILELALLSTDVVDWTETDSHFEWNIIESDVATMVAQ